MADKVVHDHIWSEEVEDTIKIGFTSEFIQQLEECWHVLPAHIREAKEKAPLLCVETNDGLVNIFSPCSGTIVRFNSKARDFPDRVTSEDVILEISKKKPEARPKAVSRDEPQRRVRAENVLRPAGAVDPFTTWTIPTAPTREDQLGRIQRRLAEMTANLTNNNNNEEV